MIDAELNPSRSLNRLNDGSGSVGLGDASAISRPETRSRGLASEWEAWEAGRGSGR